MRFSYKGRNVAIATLAATLSLFIGHTAQADTMRLADNHTSGSSEMMSDDATMSGNTIVDVASNGESFSTLVQAVKAADLAGTLSGEGPYTVFAPTDEAFNQLPDGALEFLLEPENQDLLAQVLKYHVVSGSVMSSDLSTGGVSTLGGGVAIRVSDSGVVVNNASVTNADLQASNGVIHVINRVLIPESLQQQLASRLGVADIY